MIHRLIVLGSLLGLVGCFGEGRPLEDYLRDESSRRLDAGAGAGGGGGQATVEFPPEVCSVQDTRAVRIAFVNESARTVEVLWVDGECGETPYRTLGPGESYIQPTYRLHAWRVRDAATREILVDFTGVEAEGTDRVVIQ